MKHAMVRRQAGENLQAIRAAEDIAKAEAVSKGRDKPKPVNTRHTTDAVNDLIGKPPKLVPVRRRHPIDGDTDAIEDLRRQIDKLVGAAASIPNVPANLLTIIRDMARHPWSRLEGGAVS